jgi:molybdopterin converting factor small subunit
VKIKIHVIIRGRIGDDWKDIDAHVKLASGTTLGAFVDSSNLPLREALANSPHLVDTLMLNGERCPIADNRERVLADGDELYLLAPLAGG